MKIVFFFFFIFFFLFLSSAAATCPAVPPQTRDEQPGGTIQGEFFEKVGRLGKSGWFSDVLSSAPPSSPALKAAGGQLEAGSGAEQQYKRGNRSAKRRRLVEVEFNDVGARWPHQSHLVFCILWLVWFPSSAFAIASYESCFTECACVCTCTCVCVCTLMRTLNSSLRAAADLWTSRCLHHLLSCSL